MIAFKVVISQALKITTRIQQANGSLLTMVMSRREFVGALGAAAGLLHPKASAKPVLPGRRLNMKVGLYSISFLGKWYRGEALTLEELIKRAKKYGYDGVEVDGKRPHGNPLDMPRSRCRELRSIAAGEGIDIYGVAANNDFSSPIPEHRECQILYVRELIHMTSDLGARTLRVFLAWPGVTEEQGVASYGIAVPRWEAFRQGFSDQQVWDWCREGLVECARYAGDAGITLALQNHKPVIKTHHDVLRMVREVSSPHLKVSLDAPIMPVKTPEYIRQAALDVGPLQVLSHFGGEYERGADGKVECSPTYKPGADFYIPFIRAMNEIGYSGYIGYELCHSLPMVNGKTVGIEFAEKNAHLAAEFMRNLIRSQVE
jgi:sugar phosphate isomerase/epimerase